MWSWGEIDEKTDDIQARSFMARTLGEKWESMPSWRRGKSGHMKTRNSIMQEDYAEFISLTLRTRNLRSPSRMLARNWKHQWLPLCLARSARTMRIVEVVHPIKSNAYGRIFAESSWRPYCGKRRQFTTALQLGSQIYSCASSYENSSSKGSSGQGMGKIGENFGVERDESQK